MKCPFCGAETEGKPTICPKCSEPFYYPPTAQTIRTKIAGVTHRNSDGSDRQQLLRRCRANDSLILEREPGNPYDPNAIKVLTANRKQLGYLNRNLAEQLAAQLNEKRPYRARILEVTGEDPMGCNIEIDVTDSTPAPQEQSPRERRSASHQCQICHVPMRAIRKARHSQVGAALFLLVGIILCITVVGLIVGVPLVLVGLYLGIPADKFWMCPRCRVLLPKA